MEPLASVRIRAQSDHNRIILFTPAGDVGAVSVGKTCSMDIGEPTASGSHANDVSLAGRQVRWPAYAMAVVFLGYAVGKAVFAAQGRMGFPGGPVVSAAEHERYARDVMDVATTQWLGVATGLLGVVLVTATVADVGRRVPRKLMLLMLAAAVAGLGAGAGILIVDGFTGLFGVGWQWYHGVLGIIMLALMMGTSWSYAQATK